MLEFAHQEHIKSYYFDSRNQAFELPPLTAKKKRMFVLLVLVSSVYLPPLN